MKIKSLLVIAMIAMSAVRSYADVPHTFTLDVSSWQEKPKTVAVAGAFNGWNTSATPLKPAGQVWSAAVTLPEGVTAYKFVVDGERWLTDPKADVALNAPDGNGGQNSGVRINGTAGKPATDNPAAAAGHRFSLDASALDVKPKGVSVTGTFNNWNKEAVPMRLNNGVWSANVPLPDGLHHYKFVLDNDRFIPDPKGDSVFDIPDGYGGHNSGVLIGPDARKLPAVKPNHVEVKGLRFDPNDLADLNIVDDRTLRLRIRTQANDVEQVHVLHTNADGGAERETVQLQKIGTAIGYDAYGGTVTVAPQSAGKSIAFHFSLTDGTAKVSHAVDNTAPSAGTAAVAADTTVTLKPTFITPDWARHAVWYQIFPERFRNGDPSNDQTNDLDETFIRWTSKWADAQPNEAPGAENFYQGGGNVWKRRYGGDIKGLRESLPYLKKLGITAIYLNPVFEADSMHKYDATDFRHIDDNFGVKGDWPVAGETDDPTTWKWSASDRLFLDFVADVHKEGMKVIIDGVWNHVGRPHPYFQDVLEKGKNSKYADWFEIIDWGDEKNWKKHADPLSVHGKPGGIQWKAWDGVNGHLPAFKKSNETGLTAGPAAHIMAVTKRWLAPDGDPSKGVDGFRLDAPNEIPHPFWIAWRKVVKETKPDAYITGEIWSPAQPWINNGDQYDAVMNYQFAMPAQAFFVNQKTATKPSEFLNKLTEVVYMYPQQASLVMQNLFDSHDTDRLASMFVNPDVMYDAANRIQDNGPNYKTRKPNAVERQRMMQAVACQMTYLGAPMIYYGTEAGMWSEDDPSNRQPMTWPEMKFDDPQVGFDQSIFDQFQKLIAIRQSLPALKEGDFFPVSSDDAAGTLVYGRKAGDAIVYVALNRSAEAKSVKVAAKGAKDWTDRVTDKTLSVTEEAAGLSVDLPAYGYAILAAKK